MLPDPGNALPVATDFRSPEQGFCVESAPDSKKESPDAVDLGSCEALCRATAGCVAVSYYGDGALNGWRGKCYLSLGDCTAHASTVGGMLMRHIAAGDNSLGRHCHSDRK
jgi:hypothetical protein